MNMNASFTQIVRNILYVVFSKELSVEAQGKIALLRDGSRKLPEPTPEGKAILKQVLNRDGHLTTAALAGTGKTTINEHIINSYPNATARASTLHAFGLNAYRYWYKTNKGREFDTKNQLNKNKIRLITESLFNPPVDSILDEQKKNRAISMISCICELVDKAKLLGFGAFLPMPTDDDFLMLMDRFEIEVPDDDNGGFDNNGIAYEQVVLPKAFNLARRVLDANNKTLDMIDYTDMIYLPLALNIRFLWQDLILIDEAQDLNPIAQEMIRRVAGYKGMCTFTGDENQAIMGFAGADCKSMNTIQNIFKTTVMPLTWCFRCPRVVIKQAQEIVPAIKAAPGAIMGEVWHLTEKLTVDDEGNKYCRYEKLSKEVYDGDFIICRTTSPLVSLCLSLIGRGVPASVRGKSIGDQLKKLADTIRGRRDSRGKSISEAISIYRDKQIAKFGNDEAKKASFLDRVSAVVAVSEECDNWGQVITKIENMFVDVKDGEITPRSGVVLCTAHKSKGLQAKNVYIINPDLMPHPCAKKEDQIQQEWNLKYVAITRAMNKLTWVHTSTEPTNTRTLVTLDADDNYVETKAKEEQEPTKVEEPKKTTKEVTEKRKASRVKQATKNKTKTK
jgi:hypothetical protein